MKYLTSYLYTFFLEPREQRAAYERRRCLAYALIFLVIDTSHPENWFLKYLCL